MNQNHHNPGTNNTLEYFKFFGVMSFITALSAIHADWRGMELLQFFESFMGVFFIVFAVFKLVNLKSFAYGFQSYDLIAAKSLPYSFAYPFVQFLFGAIYLFGAAGIGVDIAVLVISLISGAGVLKALSAKKDVHCVCLGNVIKLPLSTISFVEDFGMAVMALIMIMLR